MVYHADTNLRHFKTSYIAIDKVFSALSVDYFADTTLTDVSTGVGTRTYSGVFNLNIPALDISHTLTVIPFLVGIDSTTVSGEHTVFWSVSIRDANSLNYELTVKHTTRVTEIVSYILIVDRTSAETGYEFFLDQIEVTGQDNTPNGETLTAFDPSTIHLGVNSFEFTLPSFDITSSLVLTSGGYYKEIRISLWSYRERHCSGT